MTSRSETTIDRKVTYMITISCQQKKAYINKSLLDEVINYLKMSIDDFKILEQVYENTGKYKQLHYHAIVTVPKEFRYKRFSAFGLPHITGNTYSINWRPVYNFKRACSYLKKDLQCQTQDDIFTNNYYSINRFNEIYDF